MYKSAEKFKCILTWVLEAYSNYSKNIIIIFQKKY